MSTAFSPRPFPLEPSPAATTHRTGNGARHLTALLLAAAVSTLVVIADRLIDTWADDHLFLGWVALWVLIFAGLALFANPAGRLASCTMSALDSGSRSLAEARSEGRIAEMTSHGPQAAPVRSARVTTAPFAFDYVPSSRYIPYV